MLAVLVTLITVSCTKPDGVRGKFKIKLLLSSRVECM